MQVAVDTQESSDLRRLFTNVERSCLPHGVELLTSEPLLQQEIFRPRRIHHFHTIGIGPAKILIQSPAERAISQVNQPDFAQDVRQLSTSLPVDFDIEHDGYWTIPGSRHMDESE